MHLSDLPQKEPAEPDAVLAPAETIEEPSPSSLVSQVQRAAADQPKSLPAEFIGFMRTHRAWWLAPFLIALALFALLVWSGGAAATPFVYPLF